MIAVILLGGIGSRLYPLSTKENPKQFLKLYENDQHSFFQKTVLRLYNCKIRNFVIVINGINLNRAKEQIGCLHLNDANFYYCVEPFGRNTAGAIYYACLFISTYFDMFHDEQILVCPSDHLMDDNVFKDLILNTSFDKTKIYLFGIKPLYPETQYGYIQINEHNNIVCFHEKPDIERANYYINNKNFFWNSGVLIFDLYHFMNLVLKHCHNVANNVILERFQMDLNVCDLNSTRFSQCENISIEYALMEKINSGKCVIFNGYWNDIGNFKSWIQEKSNKKDKNNNVVDTVNPIIVEQCKNIFVENRTDNKIIMKNVENIAVVVNENVICIFKSL